MSYAQGLRLVTRTIAVYLICWAITDLIEIPGELTSVLTSYRLLNAATDSARDASMQHFYLQSSFQFLAQNLIRVPLWSAAAVWFHRCGPRVQRYFGLEESRPD